MNHAITIDALSKEFIVSHEAYASLKGKLLWWRRPTLQKLLALDSITFNVDKGECVAIIGPNGAGKSTLLSILARVYKPTSGKVFLNGHVAPLLELGAGFHPDLTGIENVYFNGVILGLTRQQVAERMEDIVTFSELGAYIDAPIRTYSSGMLLRLGFSVAIHVDASILLVDEALAVGDLEFQKKCFNRITTFKERGGAILFVSHDMTSVRQAADRTIWMQSGSIKMEGTTNEVVDAYEASNT